MSSCQTRRVKTAKAREATVETVNKGLEKRAKSNEFLITASLPFCANYWSQQRHDPPMQPFRVLKPTTRPQKQGRGEIDPKPPPIKMQSITKDNTKCRVSPRLVSPQQKHQTMGEEKQGSKTVESEVQEERVWIWVWSDV